MTVLTLATASQDLLAVRETLSRDGRGGPGEEPLPRSPAADSITHLHDWYTGAGQLRQRYSPRQLDGRRVGHHGFFRVANADLWDELVLPWVATAGADEISDRRSGSA